MASNMKREKCYSATLAFSTKMMMFETLFATRLEIFGTKVDCIATFVCLRAAPPLAFFASFEPVFLHGNFCAFQLHRTPRLRPVLGPSKAWRSCSPRASLRCRCNSIHLYGAEARISPISLHPLGFCSADLSGIRRESQPDSSLFPASTFCDRRQRRLALGC